MQWCATKWGQVYDAVRQLWEAVSLQCRQVESAKSDLVAELQRFQSGGPQRAMAAVFHKLMRDLVTHVSELDELVALGQSQPRSDEEGVWIDAVCSLRDRFESQLGQWGCQPIPIDVGQQLFSPEEHHAVDAEPGEIPESADDNVIVKVRQRGWTLHGHVVQYPRVVVS